MGRGSFSPLIGDATRQQFSSPLFHGSSGVKGQDRSRNSRRSLSDSRLASSASSARSRRNSKNSFDWPMKSPSLARAVNAPMAAPFVSVARMIEHTGNLRLRNGHGSGMIRFVWKSSPPKGEIFRLGNTRLVFVESVRGASGSLTAFPALSCQV